MYSFTRKGRRNPSTAAIPFIPMEDIPIGRLIVVPTDVRNDPEKTGTYLENGDLLVAKNDPFL